MLWEACTNFNYWHSDCDVVAVKDKDKIYYFTRILCPYKWSILIQKNAKICYLVDAQF